MDIITANLVEGIKSKKAAVAAVLAPVLAPLLPDAQDPVSTTAALASLTNAINTTGKYAGKQVFNTTTNVLVIATGATAASTWVAAGVVAHTPV